MSKNNTILKIFMGVMFNNKKDIELVTPKHYVKDIFEINYKQLKKEGYIYLLFDIDNTIMPVNDINVTKKLQNFFANLKKDFMVYLVSNNNKERVKIVANKLKVEYIHDANKPICNFKSNINYKKSVMIGDQMLSDIVYGNKVGALTILVDPYSNHYDIKTGINRILQNIMLKKLKNKIKKHHYF